MNTTNLPRRKDRLAQLRSRYNSIGAKSTAVSLWHTYWHWLVLFLLGMVFVTYEVIDHSRMLRQYGVDISLLEDGEFVREVIAFGLVLPILAGLLVGRMTRMRAQRDAILKELEERRAFVEQMNGAVEWHSLVDLVASYPGSVTAANSTYLLVQRSPDEPFDLISKWRRPSIGLAYQVAPILPAQCIECPTSAPGSESAVIHCQDEGAEVTADGLSRYCMCLLTGEMQKTVLAFDLPDNQTISQHQTRLLEEMGPEMALALDNANLLQRELKRAEATDTERQRFARDLHDTMAQTIGYLRLKLDQFSEEGSQLNVADIQVDIVRMRDAAEEANEQIREMLADLEPVYDTDLTATLCERALVMGERQGFAIHLDCMGEPLAISPEVQRQVLYICRETLNNVGRHAKAKNVAIQLQWGKDDLRLSITDDGSGFNPDAVLIGDHLGLSIMKQRAQELNGRIVIRSAPGKGTEVFLWLPTDYTSGEAVARTPLIRTGRKPL